MSDRALQRAIDFAKALHTEIILVHIVDSRFVPPSTTLGLINEKTTLEDAKKQIIRILKTGAEAMLKDRIDMTQKNGVHARFILGVGSPANEIASIAETEGVEMIVIGSRQLRGDRSIVLGSVARRVSEISKCPVMITR